MDGHGCIFFFSCSFLDNAHWVKTREKSTFFPWNQFHENNFFVKLISPLCNDYYLDIVSKKYLFSLFQRSNKRKVTGRNQALLSSAISSTREETQKSTKWDPVLFALKAAKNFFHRPFYGGGPAFIQIQNP